MDIEVQDQEGTADGEPKARRYSAPALEKGLDILELISSSERPLTVTAMTQSLGRSTGELFRMIQVLEYRGYIRALSGGAYVPTSKLFLLGMAQPPVKSLIDVALPVMRRLAYETEQGCHLCFRAESDTVVAARVESASLLGFSVRLGYRQPIPASASGVMLYASQPFSTRKLWEATFRPALEGAALEQFRERADDAAARGYMETPSDIVPGILDIATVIMRGDVGSATLAMPYVERKDGKVGLDRTRELLMAGASQISDELAASDVRI